MVVSGWGKAGKVEMSYNEFDGVTPSSASCNGQHYWTFLFIGEEDYYTFVGSYLHDVSGRAPHVGTDYTNELLFFHGISNYFENVGGHAFEIGINANVLLEGNYFQSVTTPMASGTLTAGGHVYDTITVDEPSVCASYIGYYCEWNKAYSSGTLYDLADTSVLSRAASYSRCLSGHVAVANVFTNGTAHAGVGKI